MNEILKAVRGQAKQLLKDLYERGDKNFLRIETNRGYLADKLLSIRLNDKLEPDPKGRYAVRVVDLEAKRPELSEEQIARIKELEPTAKGKIERAYYDSQLDMIGQDFEKVVGALPL